jgi:hypothetical protein
VPLVLFELLKTLTPNQAREAHTWLKTHGHTACEELADLLATLFK